MGKQYELPMASVSIVDGDGTELYSTVKVNSTGLATKRVYDVLVSGKDLEFLSWSEVIPFNSEIMKLRGDEAIYDKQSIE